MLREKLLKQVSIINNLNSFQIFIRYSLITTLLIGLYLLWNENKSLKHTLSEVTTQLNIIEEKNNKLQQSILQSKQTLKIQSTQKINEQKKENLEKTLTKQNVDKTTSKQILIVLPENEKNYSKVIPNIDYKDISLEKDSKNIKKENNLKISPEVFIDKDEKKINGGKINFETKF